MASEGKRTKAELAGELDRLRVRLGELEEEYRACRLEGEALRRKEEQFRLLFEGAPLAYQSLDMDGRFIIVNDVWLRMFGYQRADVLGHSFAEFVAPGFGGRFKDMFESYLRDGRADGVEFDVLHKGGMVVPVAIHGRVVEGPDGIRTHCIVHDVSESKRAERELRREKEFVTAILQNSYDGIAVADQRGRFKYVSPGMERIFGLAADEMPDLKAWAERVLPEPDRARQALAVWAEDLAQPLPPERFFSFRHPGGETRWCRVKVAPMQSGDLVINGQDVTGLRNAEMDLRENEERLRTLVEASPDSIILKDGQGRWVLSNRANLEVFCLEGKDWRGRTDLDLAKVLPRCSGVLEECSRTDEEAWAVGRLHRTEEKMPGPDGRGRVFDIIKMPLFDDRGERQSLIVIGREVTEQRRAQEEIRKLSRVVEQSPVTVMITNPDGDIEYVNPTFSRVTGYGREEVIGRNPRFLNSGRHPPGFYASLWETISSGKAWRGELCNRRKDGDIFWESASISAITDSRGKLLHYVAVKEDITERKRQEEKIMHLALHDVLTGLPNRILFVDRLNRAIGRVERTNNKAALLYMDLDEFKPVNDELGHEAGDAVLKTVAVRLQACLRGVDTAARVGGDEFVVILQDIQHDQDIDYVAKRIVESIQEPIRLEGGERVVGLSMGISVCPEHGEDVDTLLRKADRSMYRAKREGKNRIRYHSED